MGWRGTRTARGMKSVTRHKLILNSVERDGSNCIWCNRPLYYLASEFSPDSITIEHIISRCYGGNDSPCNIALSCHKCNHNHDTKNSCPSKLRMLLLTMDLPRLRELQKMPIKNVRIIKFLNKVANRAFERFLVDI